jgi:hypothetical protein
MLKVGYLECLCVRHHSSGVPVLLVMYIDHALAVVDVSAAKGCQDEK